MKSFLRQFTSWLLSCAFGAVGGYAYAHWKLVHESQTTTVRASRFELTDATGRVVSFWGGDRGNNTVLAFLQTPVENGSGQKEITLPPEATRLTGQNPNEAIAVGMLSTQIPFMNILGNDGNSRASLYLNEQQKPIFNMADEKQESRLELGFISADAPTSNDDDWALRFRAPNVAGIGSIRNPVDHRYRGYLSVEKNPKQR